ncbi:unnamed protein product [Lampetra fluviatilis]
MSRVPGAGIVQPFLGDCQETLAKMDNPSMKSIRGLEDRLFVLDQLLSPPASASSLSRRSWRRASWRIKKRAGEPQGPVGPARPVPQPRQPAGDHAQQPQEAAGRQAPLRHPPSMELTDNLHVRLRWCYYVMHHADLGREKLQALCHVLRELTGREWRWASLLVRDGKELYQAERERREAFRQIFGHSFLKGRLFQGLESWPPSSFCTREPRAFDEQLPAVTLEDLHFLQSHSPPEMQPYLQLPTLCDFELLREHSARGRRLARAVRGAQDASLALAQLLSTKTLVGRSDGRGEAGSWEGESPASPDRPGSLLLLSPPSHGDTGDPGREDAGAHGGHDVDLLTRDNRDLSPDSIDSQVFDFETINHPAAETHPPLSSAALTAAASTVAATAQAISPRSAGLLQSPGAVVESLYASVINAIDSQRRMRREGGDGDGDGDGGDGAMGDSRLSSPHPDSWSSPSNRSDVRSRSAVARGRGCAAAFTALRASTAGVRRELAGLGEQVRSDGRQLAGLLADARRHLEEALPAHRESSSDSTSEANDVERRPLADPSHHLAQLQQQQREEEEEEVRVRGLDAELTCEAERVRGLEVQLAQEAERRSDLETELAEGAERCQGLRVELAQEAQRRNSQQVLLAQQAERKMSLEVELTQEAEKHRGLAAELTQETERRVGLEKELARETERRMSLETDLVQETGRRVGWEMELTQQAEKRVTLEKELVVESERRHFLESELAQEAERRVGLETELAEEAERRVGLETELAEDAGKRMGLEKELAREAERRVGLETELVQEAERRVGLETELALEAQKRRALETKLSDESKKTVGLEAQLAEETARSQGLTAELTQETERSQTLETMLSEESERRERLEMELIQEAESHQALDTKLAEEAQKRTGLMVELARETERRRNLEAELVQEAETRVSLETELTQEAERWRGLAAGLAQETNRRILLEADLAHEVKAHRELVAALADETERRHELQAELADRAAEREASLHGLAALLEHERELAVAELLSCHEAEVARLTAELRQAETRVQRLEEQGEEAGGLTVELQEGVLDVEWRSREASRGRRREKPVGVALKTAGSEAGHHQQQHQQQQHQQHQQQQHQQHQQQQQGLTIAAERGLKTGASSEPQDSPPGGPDSQPHAPCDRRSAAGPAGGERLIKGKVITELGEKLQRLLEQHDRDKEAIEKLLSEKTFLEETVARLKGTHDLAAASPSSPNVAEARAQQPPPLQPPTQPTQPTQPLQPRGWLRARGSSVGHGTSAVAGQPGLLQAVAWGLTSGVLGAGEAREGRKEPSGGGGGGAGGGAGVVSAAMPLERTRTPLLFLPVECGDSVGGDGGGGDGAAMAMAGDGLDASVVALRENAPSEDKQRVLMLEKALHQKEKEHSRLVQRLMSQSVAPVSPRQPEKLAIKDVSLRYEPRYWSLIPARGQQLTLPNVLIGAKSRGCCEDDRTELAFQVGDLVLIILDERHDNYVVFTVGPTLYFLHAESLPPLELRPVPGVPRKPWVLGRITEKEYCQAKKAQNRFRVPVGTKFYRVKAEPWGRRTSVGRSTPPHPPPPQQPPQADTAASGSSLAGPTVGGGGGPGADDFPALGGHPLL